MVCYPIDTKALPSFGRDFPQNLWDDPIQCMSGRHSNSTRRCRTGCRDYRFGVKEPDNTSFMALFSSPNSLQTEPVSPTARAPDRFVKNDAR